MKNRMLIMLLLSLLIVIKGYTGLNFLMWAVFIILALLIVFDDEKYKSYYMLYFLPWAMVMKFNEGQISLYSFLNLIYVLINCTIFIKRKEKIHLFSIISIIILTCILLCSSLINASFNILGLVSWILNLLSIYIMINSISNIQDLTNLILCLLCGTITSGIVGMISQYNVNLLQWLSKFTTTETVKVNGKIEYRFSGLDYDPNYFSVVCLISAWTYLLSKSRKSFLDILLIGMVIFMGILTISKMYIFTLLFSFLFYFICVRKNKTNLKKILIFIIIAMPMFFLVGDKIFQAFYERMKNISTFSELSTGRSDIWKLYLEYFKNNPYVLIIGKGLDAEYVMGHAAHNSILTGLYRFGILGIIVLFGYFNGIYNFLKIKCLKIQNGNTDEPINDRNLIAYIPIILLMITCMALDTIKSDMFPYLIMICLFPIVKLKGNYLYEKN